MLKLIISKPNPVKTNVYLPIYSCAVSAGFPSHADDFIDKKIDLNELLVKRPSSTFFVRVAGDSMIGAGIFDGDTLVIDRSIEVKNGSIVVSILNGEFTVKRFLKIDNKIYLKSENPAYMPIKIDELSDFEVWGVATNVIHSLK